MTVIDNSTINSHVGEEHAIGTVILFLSFAVLAGCVCKLILSQILKNKFPAPFTVIVLILGFSIGMIIAHIYGVTNDFLLGEKVLREINPHLIYYIFLPLLIFDSAFNSHFHVIRPHILSAILLAGPGVLISTSIVAVFGVYIFPYHWSWLVSIMFGSILSATDPVAVVALLHESGASKSLAALIDLESLLNDGSAFVIFMVFRDIVVGKSDNAKKIIIDIAKFTIGGPAFGIACGIVAVIVFNLIHNEPEVEIISTFGLAYLIFYVADVEIGVSAVLAVVVMGLFMAKHKYCISSHVQVPMANTWRIIIDFANILIFIITGIILAHSLIGTKTTIIIHDFGFSILLYIAIHLARLSSALILYPFIRWSGVHLSWREYTVLVWGGLRGSMSVILALMVDSEEQIDIETRHRFLFHICMITLLTLIINGTSSKFLVRLLGVDHGTPESERILVQALEHMRKQTAIQLHKMKQEKQFSDVDWTMLNEYLPETLVQEMDAQRRTSVHRRFSVLPEFPDNILQDVHEKSTVKDIELKSVPSICETDSIPINFTPGQQYSTLRHIVWSTIDMGSSDKNKNENVDFRNELTTRFLTALLVDYEKQWFLGMIRRRTLYILIQSVEKAKHQHSLKVHWQLIVEHFRLSRSLKILMRFNGIDCIKKQSHKLLFDHIFLTIELTLAFHSARTRMDNIQKQFPELAKIDERIWHEVYQEIHFYHVTATYILLDIQQSYELCWQIHMTKRCAQILLKYELKMITELYETGMLGKSIYSHINELIEKKLFSLEFYRVQMPKGHVKAIKNAFDLLPFFQSLAVPEYRRWKAIMKPTHRWFQPNKTLIKKGDTVSTAYLIVRGIVQCDIDTVPIYYRSGNIIGIDALFSQNLTAHDTYFVSGGLLEAYRIDNTLLNQFLNDENLAPSIYREIARHILTNSYQERVPLNRLQVRLLLHQRAKFYWNQSEISIQLKENQRLFILAGNVIHLSNNEKKTYESIQLQIFDSEAEILLNSSTVAYSWMYEDEEFCSKDTDLTVHFPLQTHGLLSNDLLYPGYSGEITSSPERRRSSLLVNSGAHSTEV
ncbi:unnamed protein product [Adineta steineri]|uniref:Cyclic nucleotide-binding domain-containing protein n=1 Tax=Adineta steineri TaxID=433720 RepID=A0A814RSF9_9BILA|nr:unnamed protein product [Adineta steineri]CAF1137954.1 unnamed protein product [Adineta steineri]